MSAWHVILALGLGTYMTRFVFLGIVGDRPLPAWLLRHLRYTGVAILPGLVAPLVVWPDGGADPVKLLAAAATLGVGMWRRNAIPGVLAGGAVMALGALI